MLALLMLDMLKIALMTVMMKSTSQRIGKMTWFGKARERLVLINVLHKPKMISRVLKKLKSALSKLLFS
jgi:hypothetical protein